MDGRRCARGPETDRPPGPPAADWHGCTSTTPARPQPAKLSPILKKRSIHTCINRGPSRRYYPSTSIESPRRPLDGLGQPGGPHPRDTCSSPPSRWRARLSLSDEPGQWIPDRIASPPRGVASPASGGSPAGVVHASASASASARPASRPPPPMASYLAQFRTIKSICSRLVVAGARLVPLSRPSLLLLLLSASVPVSSKDAPGLDWPIFRRWI